MKPLKERKQYVDYMGGKLMPASDFNNGGLDIYSDYVFSDVLKEHCTRQLDFDGEVWYRKTRPVEIKSNEEIHLSRDITNPLTDAQKLAICRAELAKYGK